MEIQGRLIKILDTQRGESARGPWVRGGFVIETDGDYPRQVAFTLFGEDRLSMVANIPMGSMVNVRFNPESREFQERWYTDLRCSFIQAIQPGQVPGVNAWQPQPTAAPQQPVAAPQSGFAQPVANTMPSDADNDLPF